MSERHSSTVGHTDVICPTCGQNVRVEFVASDGEAIGGAFAVGLRADTTHLCPSPDGGERIAS